MNGIVWLASYPKSGNTWLRAVLANYQRGEARPVDINELDGIASDRHVFDQFAGVEASDLTGEELEALRPAVYQQLAGESQETPFVKIHDAFTAAPRDKPSSPQRRPELRSISSVIRSMSLFPQLLTSTSRSTTPLAVCVMKSSSCRGLPTP